MNDKVLPQGETPDEAMKRIARVEKATAGIDAIVLTRAGHFYTPGADSCEAAIVIAVWSPKLVNLDVVNGSGTHRAQTSVTVDSEPTEYTTPTFHLSRDCPWGR